MRAQNRPLPGSWGGGGRRHGGPSVGDGQLNTGTAHQEGHNCSIVSLYLPLELSLYPGLDVYRPGLKSQAYPKK